MTRPTSTSWIPSSGFAPSPPNIWVLETKGFASLEGVKVAATRRWVAAVNAEGGHGEWAYAIAKRVADVETAVARAALN